MEEVFSVMPLSEATRSAGPGFIPQYKFSQGIQMSSYLVIARKWRPSLFEEIVGQGHVTRTLRNAISSGRVAHAYLFSGPRGVGKTTAARILAKGLNCANGPTPVPCNECASCRGIATGSSVDVFEIDGASNNSVDNVRELTESVRYVPTHGKYKVYIIDEVHMLSVAAFNALLKTLEEPPPHAVFIFATTEVHKIPLTILSRCQRFDFKRIPFRELQGHLKKIVEEEGIEYEDKAVFQLAREADGSLRDGQSLLEQVLAYSGKDLKESDVSDALGLMDRSVLYDLLSAVIRKDPGTALNIVEKIYDFGYDLKRGCSELLEHVRDLTVLKSTGAASLLDLPDSEIERLGALAEAVELPRLHMIFSMISRGYEEVVKGASPRFSFEMSLLKAAEFDDLKPVEELISRIEALRQKIEGTGGANGPRPEAPKGAVAVGTGARFPERPSFPRKSAPEVAPVAPPKASEATAPYSAPPVSQGFSDLIGYIRARNAELAEPFSVATLRLDGDCLDVSAPGRAGGKILSNKGAIEAALEDFYKRPVKLRLGGLGSTEKKKDDPVVADARRILGARVIEDRRRTNV